MGFPNEQKDNENVNTLADWDITYKDWESIEE